MSKSVLIVEDEMLIRTLCADVFGEAEYEVIEAENGDQALDMLRFGIPVIAIVSDIRMPGRTDGMALRREVEANWPDVKMLMTSGDRHVDCSELSENQVFIAKPYQVLDLVQHVDEMIIGDATG